MVSSFPKPSIHFFLVGTWRCCSRKWKDNEGTVVSMGSYPTWDKMRCGWKWNYRKFGFAEWGSRHFLHSGSLFPSAHILGYSRKILCENLPYQPFRLSEYTLPILTFYKSPSQFDSLASLIQLLPKVLFFRPFLFPKIYWHKGKWCLPFAKPETKVSV
jgi:hypothetical protein